MSKIETGGPAYPFVVETGPDYYGRKSHKVERGMTIRDQFAAHALNGLLAADQECGFKPDVAAEYAYRFADAMLRARGGDRD